MNWVEADNLYVFDCEVFPYDWFFVFKNHATGEKSEIHNDPIALKMMMSGNPLLCGFNSKHYDDYIIRAICSDMTNKEVKDVSDRIIGGENGFSIEFPSKTFIQGFDLRDDMQVGTSLKSIEGALGLNIKETDVDFNLDRPLTEEECKSTFFYCGCDVDTTEKLMLLRKDYLDAKVEIGASAGLTPEQSLACTNAKIVAKLLGAVRKTYTDGRKMELPKEVNYSYVPEGLADFFMKVNDLSIKDDDLFKRQFVTDIGGCPCTFAWGGCHGALDCYHAQASTDLEVQDRDVSSLYPSLLIEYNLISRSAQFPERLDEARQKRFKFKAAGDKKHATQWKLPLNTVSGAQDNKYNDLYDPHNTLTMRVTGQLLVSELVSHLVKAIQSFHLFNLNTDGFMYEVSKVDLPKVDEICEEWQKRARLSLETNPIDRLWQKDVNNVLSVSRQGKVEGIGAYLSYGISLKGAWSINNSMVVVKKGLMSYLTSGTKPKDFVESDNEMMDYQIISKMGSGFDSAYQIIKGSRQKVQKVNRCYAYKDVEYGTILKARADGTAMKIADLPEHLIIDNDNKLSIGSVDKDWYAKIIQKHINDFLGTGSRRRKKEPQKEEQLNIFMANEEVEIKEEPAKVLEEVKTQTSKKKESTSKDNVWTKLSKARLEYLKKTVTPTGKNTHDEYLYVQLADIEPYLIPIFNELGLIDITWFDNEFAYLDIINCENPEEHIQFKSPMLPPSEFKSLTGKAISTPIQGLGAIETYERRYLFLVAMGIAVPDDVEQYAEIIKKTTMPKEEGGTPEVIADNSKTKDGKVALTAKKPKTPATSIERKDIAKEVCANDGDASLEKIQALKEALRQLQAKAGTKDNKNYIVSVVNGTDHFQKVTKAEVETYMNEIKAKLSEVDK